MEQVQVTVEPGFESAAEAFEKAHAGLTTTGAAMSVTVGGREVLNVVKGQAQPGVPWAVDTPAVLMSVTKGFAGLCLAMLTDRGLLDPDDLVTKHWPEYGANGKGATTVKHVLLHTAGVLGYPEAGKELGGESTAMGDYDLIASRLAASRPSWEPGTRHGYHAVSYGWLTQELVRRVTGKTLGTFFHDEVAVPLGIETSLGTGPELAARVAKVDGSGMAKIPFPLSLVFGPLVKKMRDPEHLIGLAFLGDGERSIMDGVGEKADSAQFLAYELPSSNGVSSARDLARLYAMLAHRGELDGVRILSAETFDRFAAFQLRDGDCVMGDALSWPLRSLLSKQTRITRTMGFQLNDPPKSLGPTASTIGNEGAGGQIGFADIERGLSFGFVRTGLQAGPKPIPDLIKAVYACLPG